MAKKFGTNKGICLVISSKNTNEKEEIATKIKYAHFQIYLDKISNIKEYVQNPVRTAQLVARQTGTTEVVGSNPGKGEDLSYPNLNCNVLTLQCMQPA